MQNGRYFDSDKAPKEIQHLRKYCSINNCYISGHKEKLFVNTNCSYENAFVISKCRFENRIIEIVGIETSNNYCLKGNKNGNNCNEVKKLLNEFMENTGFDLSFVM